MFEKIKEFFRTKYRIIPVYADHQRSGYQVQKKLFWGYWINMQMSKVEKVKCESVVVTEDDALFATEEEAMNFINYQKTAI